MKIKFKNIFSHPISIALLAGAVSVLVLPLFIAQNKGSISKHRKFNRRHEIYYKDVFGKGKKVQVVATNYFPLDQGLVMIQDADTKSFYGIWNLKEKILSETPLLIGDYDNNQVKEIWAFTNDKDSLFYYLIDPEKDGGYFRERVFIATTSFVNNQKVDVRIRTIGEQDMNGDGYKEIYFAIDAGFSMTPRRIYAVDLHNDKIYKSPRFGLRFKNLYMEDLNGDGNKEIIGQTSASDNYPDTSTYPYNDNNSWLLVFDKNLNFFFEPVKFKGAPSYMAVNVVNSVKNKNLLVHFYNRSKKSGDAYICLLNSNGEKLKEVRLDTLINDYKDISIFSYNRKEWDDIYMVDRGGIIYYLNNDLEITNRINLPVDYAGNLHYLDIEKDIPGQEIIFPSSSGFLITDNAFNILAKINSEDDCIGSYNIGIIEKKNNKTRFYLSYINQHYELSFFQNPFYTYRWLVPATFSALIFLIFHLKKKYLKKKRNTKIQEKLRSQEAEKQRLAKELHDELGGKLTGLSLQIENIKENDNRESLNEITNYIYNTHKEVSNIIHNLTPPKFKEQDFVAILEHLVSEYNNYSDIKIQFEILTDNLWNRELPEHTKFHIYRILQETLTNILKHSNADKAIIQLIENKNKFSLYIEDNGQGFDKNILETSNKGLGLENVKLRSSLLGGIMNVRSDSDGTIIEIEIPLKQIS